MEALVRISVSICLSVLSLDVYSNECVSFSFYNDYSLFFLCFFFFKWRTELTVWVTRLHVSPSTSMSVKWAFIHFL